MQNYIIKRFINKCSYDLLMRWLSLFLAYQHLNLGTNLRWVRGSELAQGSSGSCVWFWPIWDVFACLRFNTIGLEERTASIFRVKDTVARKPTALSASCSGSVPPRRKCVCVCTGLYGPDRLLIPEGAPLYSYRFENRQLLYCFLFRLASPFPMKLRELCSQETVNYLPWVISITGHGGL
jgi:hypothetical protein